MTPVTSPRAGALGVPRHLRYTWDPEWLIVDGGNATVGVTAFAVQALGEVARLTLPAPGTWVEAGEACGEIGSPAAASAVYAPASGEVLEVNPALAEDPGIVNSAPYTAGWLFRLRVENIAGALTAEAYAAYCDTRGDRR
ncbi:glycine cleavage system protein H [Streptomyces sp. CoH27]|uniref:glycine cleavage system protein H n=1 Tax=Streptomyces sp. CoH27 TaxID=2875763 RepID=UPI001CD3FFAB|nr:glycine cleavage system protein H [Streptomyces sp. CoH27]